MWLCAHSHMSVSSQHRPNNHCPCARIQLVHSYTGEESIVESILNVEWIAQTPIYNCRIFGQDKPVKLKEKDVPQVILEHYADTLRGGQVTPADPFYPSIPLASDS